MKTMNKTMALLLAMIMIFTLSIGAFATDPATSIDNVSPDASYSIGATSDQITVNVSVQGVTIPYKTYSITLPELQNGGVHHVIDALLALQSDSNNHMIFEVKVPVEGNPNQFTYRTLTTGDTYFDRICYNSNNIDGADGYSGWTFRVNNLIPLLDRANGINRAMGASIAQTPICDGDRISFYYDNTSSANTAARFTRISSVERSDSDLMVTVEESHQYYGAGPSYPWTLTQFAGYAGVAVKVYDENNALIGSGQTDADGDAEITLDSTTSNTYKIVVEPNVSNGRIVYTGCEETI